MFPPGAHGEGLKEGGPGGEIKAALRGGEKYHTNRSKVGGIVGTSGSQKPMGRIYRKMRHSMDHRVIAKRKVKKREDNEKTRISQDMIDIQELEACRRSILGPSTSATEKELLKV